MSKKLEVKFPTLGCKFVDLTAKKAAEFLGSNVNNRPKSMALVERYAADILAGRYHPGASQIRFDIYGHMCDGQHTCTSVIIAEERRSANPSAFKHLKGEISIEIPVITGVPLEAIPYIDAGKARTQGDSLYASGILEVDREGTGIGFKPAEAKRLTNLLSVMGKLLYFRMYWGEDARSPRKFERRDMEQMLTEYPSLMEVLSRVEEIDRTECSKGLSSRLSLAYWAAFAWLAGHSSRKDGDPEVQHTEEEITYGHRWADVERFLRKVGKGEKLESDDPCYVLREWLVKKPGNAGGHWFQVVVKAFEAFRTSAKVPAGKERNAMLKHDAEETYMGGLDVAPEMEAYWVYEGVPYTEEQFRKAFNHDPNEPWPKPEKPTPEKPAKAAAPKKASKATGKNGKGGKLPPPRKGGAKPVAPTATDDEPDMPADLMDEQGPTDEQLAAVEG